MNYFDSLSKAYENTNALGAEVPVQFEAKPALTISDEQIYEVRDFTIEGLSRFGWKSSEHIYDQCIVANTLAYNIVTKMLGVKACITIGYVKAYGQELFKTTYDALSQEYQSPQSGKPIELHVWVTLENGYILDWCTEAYISRCEGVVKPISACMYYLNPDDTKEIDYVPLVVGK
ncbi:hypothetical protein [Spongiibacter sp.]|uniref:hypothetical protein n=1 Tax=Spongiibacter sp. TaxID=2024860 RepID=UPI000C6095B4|nr:hypothetical protein [Spongiibacter sp.]MAY37857.1 hypothetical protein [Spongiibacter sp.]|tara:strand:+ start:1671 stop:2195 length:525 start_codon:yes stop_codon:yes gene_type:complete